MRRGEASQEPLSPLLCAPLGLARSAGRGGGLAEWPNGPWGRRPQSSRPPLVVRGAWVNSPRALPREEGEAESFLGGEGLKVPLRFFCLVCPGEGLALCPTCRVPGPAAVVSIQWQQLYSSLQQLQ